MVVSTRVSPVPVGLCIVLCLMAASVHSESGSSSEEEQNNNGGDFEVNVCQVDCVQQLEQSVTNQAGELQTIATVLSAQQQTNQEQDAKLQAANDLIEKLFAYLGIYPDDWLETSCASDDDCPDGINVECYEDKCLCTPGYYYSNGQNVCVDNCPESDRLAEFLVYPRGFVANVFIASDFDSSLENCQTVCVDEPLCTNFYYFSVERDCFINTITALQRPDNFRTGQDNFVTYQKRCV